MDAEDVGYLLIVGTLFGLVVVLGYLVHVHYENQPVTISVNLSYAEPQNITLPVPADGQIEVTVTSIEITITAPKAFLEENM